ncbi:HvfC/BufC N-terminal domain-containing protein [Martelella soudanensis]|uniref:HvfC/BufC N-terminal domain-containing protein n=1 Tax=unclassified Martelella TaxID=2629616 RepID=UPI0015DE9581|nr:MULTISPECIES: DNA-binding domain-containing protein [unclassified Martelella]
MAEPAKGSVSRAQPGFPAFAVSLLSPPGANVPDGVINPLGGRADKRYAVYRNNVAMSLKGALGDIFPVTRQVAGPRFFDAMALDFLAANPPRSPILAEYGRAFPDFVAGFAPAQKLFFLADVARLERVWLDAYHAADCPPLAPETLLSRDPDTLMMTRLAAHPAARLLPLHSAAASIFLKSKAQESLKGLDPAPAETALIVRPRYDVAVHILTPGDAAFIKALFAGTPIGEAADRAGATDDAFDLSSAFALILTAGAFAGIRPENDPR